MFRKTASLEPTDLGTWGWEDWGAAPRGPASCPAFTSFSVLRTCLCFSSNEAGGDGLFPGHQTLTYTSNSSVSAKPSFTHKSSFYFLDIDSRHTKFWLKTVTNFPFGPVCSVSAEEVKKVGGAA